MTTKALTPRKRVEMAISTEDARRKFEIYLRGTKLDADKFRMTLLSQLDQNPTLANCDPSSLIQGAAVAAQIGVELVAGQAYLVPYGKKATLIVGYKGLVELMHAAGGVKSINAKCVYRGEMEGFEYDIASGKVTHPFSFDVVREKDEIVAAYATADMGDGVYTTVLMTVDELEKVRKASRASGRGPWVDWYDQMCIKTVVRRLSKLVPTSRALNVAIEAEDRAEQGQGIEDLLDVTPEPEGGDEPRDLN